MMRRPLLTRVLAVPSALAALAAPIVLTAPVILTAPVVLTGCVTEPAEMSEGSDDLIARKPELDPVRAAMKTELNMQVVFKINQRRDKAGWSFLLLKPLQTSGAPIDYKKTKYKSYLDAGAFDDTCAALVRQVGGKWTLVAYSFGGTDAAWPGWAAKYKAPAEIFQAPTATAASTERKQILDAVRAPVSIELKTPVLFQVERMKVLTGWAFLGAVPLQADGSPIDYHATGYQKLIDRGEFDGGVYALVHKVGGKWTVVAYKIGPTDVAWYDWSSQYGAPAAVFE